MINSLFTNYDVFLFDGDGVIYKEDSPLPGASKLLKHLKSLRKEIFLLTNNSTRTRSEYLNKFKEIGISLELDNVLTSAYLTAVYLSDYHSKSKLYVIGEQGLKDELNNLGLHIINNFDEKNSDNIFDFNIDEADIVVTGMDRNLNYVKIARGMNILLNRDKETAFIATNGDMTFPTEKGLIPGGGTMIKILEELCGKEIEKIIGKPSDQMYLQAIKKSNVPVEKAIMFGDRIETDILGAKNLGITTCLVLSGVTSMQDLSRLNEENSPDIIINSLEDVLNS